MRRKNTPDAIFEALSAQLSNISLQKRITVLALLLFAVKLFAWFLTNSTAILTDALESVVNVAAAFLGLYSIYLSAKPKDSDHPYGHGKVEFISAAVEGSLIIIAGIFIIFRAVDALFGVHRVFDVGPGILLIAGTAIINLIAGKICLRQAARTKSPALEATGRHLISDTYTTAGIIAGLLLVYIFDKSWIDSAVAIMFALVIVFSGYRIIRRSLAGIMDEADTSLLRNVVQTLNDNRRWNWMDIHNLRIIKYGPTLHLDAHLTVPWYLNIDQAHREIDELSGLLRKEYGDSLEIFIHTDGCRATSCPICIKPDCAVRQHELVKRIEWTLENISKNERHSLSGKL